MEEKFPRTIGVGARKYITGIEHLELLLGEPYVREYPLHDSQIPWFHYDHEARKLDVEIWVTGSMYKYPMDKRIFIHFCFEDVTALETSMEGWCDIYALSLTVEHNTLVCEFDNYYMKVWAKHLTISPIEMRDPIKE